MLRKFGTGKILDEDQKEVSKEASKDSWTEEDQKELREENRK